MKHFLFTLLLGSILLTGCASQYLVVLNNGQRVIAVRKPHLEGFNFVFTDPKGRTNSIPSEQVRGIVPVSTAK
jgi:hypothetical protein